MTLTLPNPPPPLLVAESVNKIYRTGDVSVPAFEDLDLTVSAGELGEDHPAELPVRPGRHRCGPCPGRRTGPVRDERR